MVKNGLALLGRERAGDDRKAVKTVAAERRKRSTGEDHFLGFSAPRKSSSQLSGRANSKVEPGLPGLLLWMLNAVSGGGSAHESWSGDGARCADSCVRRLGDCWKW